MARKKNAKKARLRGIPIVLKVLALCLLAVVALLILLPAPPDLDAGGVTHVAKRVPERSESVKPLAEATPPVTRSLARPPEATTSEVVPAAPEQTAAATNPAAAPVVAPEPQPPVEPEPISAPAPEPQPDVAVPSQPAPPNPVRKPGATQQPAASPPDQSDPPKRTLPWQIPGETAGLPPEPKPRPAPDTSGGNELPSASAVRGWVKSQAWEFLGGVDAQGNILYRFEVWLEAPQNELKAIKSVAYEYDAPSATPKSRESDRPSGGFRVRFGGLACAKEISIVLTMADGRKQQTKVDGCQVLN